MALRDKLGTSPTFERAYKDLKTFMGSMSAFDQSLDFSQDLGQLSGRARQIAEQICGELVPEVRMKGQRTLGMMVDLVTQINYFAREMVTFCENFGVAVWILSSIRLQSAGNTAGSIKDRLAQMLTELNNYHTDINQLISALASEESALSSRNAELKKERERLLEKLHDETHPDSIGDFFKAAASALTGQLSNDIRNASGEMARMAARYRANTLAIGGLKHLETQAGGFRSLVEQQQTFWVNNETNLKSVAEDVQDLKNDPGSADIEMEALRQDWAAYSR